MAKRDDEVQREMTRYCAGIDHWDAMSVVVEGWLRVFEGLQEQRDALLVTLGNVEDYLATSPYATDCDDILSKVREAIAKSGGPMTPSASRSR